MVAQVGRPQGDGAMIAADAPGCLRNNPTLKSRRGGGAQVVDFLPVGLDRRLPPGSSTAVNYALQQNLIRRKIDVAKLFDDTTRAPRRATIGPDRAIGSRQFSL